MAEIISKHVCISNISILQQVTIAGISRLMLLGAYLCANRICNRSHYCVIHQI